MGTWSLGEGSPPAGSRGRALVGVWGQGPRSHLCIYSLQWTMDFRDVFIEDIRCTFRLMQSLLPPPLFPPKTLRICANLTTYPGRGTVCNCARAHLWLCQCQPVSTILLPGCSITLPARCRQCIRLLWHFALGMYCGYSQPRELYKWRLVLGYCYQVKLLI